MHEVGGIKKACLIIRAPNNGDIPDMTPEMKTFARLSGNAPTGKTKLREQAIEVQYNPSSLTLTANVDSIQYASLQKNACETIPNQNTRLPTVVLSVELYFDAMNPRDAFMIDKARLSAGDAVTGISRLAHQSYSVQPQTAAMLALPMREESKHVTFRWGEMAFTGVVSEIQAEYTMFSVSGKPIRSHVYMNISQEIASEGEEKYWDAVIDRMFKKKQAPTLPKGHLLNLEL